MPRAPDGAISDQAPDAVCSPNWGPSWAWARARASMGLCASQSDARGIRAGGGNVAAVSGGKVRFGSGSGGPFALNAEPEPGVRSGQAPNLEPERRVQVQGVRFGVRTRFER
ncbi:hypothetical protein B0H19DRAFT_1070915 [Mycena capillaripes]|nr:hypothetical protein B0H19DRAFT_1070915 [Mycena capillaripes]